MPRYVNEFATAKSSEEVGKYVFNYLSAEGFTYKDYTDGQKVWAKGNAWAAAPQYIMVLVKPGSVHIEAWITTCILPGVFVREKSLDGAYGFAIKAMLKGRVATLENALKA